MRKKLCLCLTLLLVVSACVPLNSDEYYSSVEAFDGTANKDENLIEETNGTIVENNPFVDDPRSGYYAYTEETYCFSDDESERYIDIHYPQFDFSSSNAAPGINEEIERVALDVLSFLPEIEGPVDPERPEWAEMSVDYIIGRNSASIISVCFISQSFVRPQAYPNRYCPTLTFDITTGTLLTLGDIVNINQELSDAFFDVFQLARSYEGWSERSIKDIVDTVRRYTTLENLLRCDDYKHPDVRSYVTEDSIVLCIAVRYQVGSYTFYETKISDIRQYLNDEWDVFGQVPLPNE